MKRTNTAKWVESAQRWQINVQKDGKRKTFTSTKPGRTGQREANAKADAWLDEGLVSRKVKVCDAWAEFFARMQKTTGKSNWRPIDGRWRTWIEPRIGNKRLESLTEQQVQAIIDDAFAAGRSRKTLQNLAGTLTAFFRFCRRSGWCRMEPVLEIPDGARKKEKTILQPTDFTKLMNSETTLYFGKRVPDIYVHYYRLAVLTGLRPGELLGLRREDVQNDVIMVRRAINAYGEETRGKNDNAVRSVPLSALAAQEMEAQLQQFVDTDGWVFRRVQERYLLKRWRAFCKANGITPCTLYELRHTFVSIAQNLPEGQLRRLVGHSRSMDTYGVYAHPFGDQGAGDVRRLDNLFSEIG